MSFIIKETAVYIQWLFICALAVVLLLVIRHIKKMQYNNLVLPFISVPEGSVHVYAQPKPRVLLFITFSDPQHMNAIAYIQEHFSDRQLIIVYYAPQWKGHLLAKKLNNQYILWIDENNDIGQKLGVYRFPSYIILSPAQNSNLTVVPLQVDSEVLTG